ncbi:hypothetical protein AQUCO_02500287v1 [Aquilegia coerulea]|uniref:Uncharacterized protein n=1 Tax=Aquilegia coerulea TaxID=218851 RepID=A0A2G5DAF8_AQUCA|nr:hypothetical protein AQUCO_02500287v1 [Aquilegia coerulea]
MVSEAKDLSLPYSSSSHLLAWRLLGNLEELLMISMWRALFGRNYSGLSYWILRGPGTHLHLILDGGRANATRKDE